MAGEYAPAQGYGYEFGEGAPVSPTAELWAELGRQGGDPAFFAEVDAICGDVIAVTLAGHRTKVGEERQRSAQGLAQMTDHYLAIFEQKRGAA